MKTTLAPTLALVLLALGACAPEESLAPQGVGGLSIVDPQQPGREWSFDLGYVAYGTKGELTVRLRNDDGRELSILDITPGCSCTRPRISYADSAGSRIQGDLRSKEAILRLPPDAIADLELEFDTLSVPIKNSPKLVVIRIVTDSPTQPYLTLEAHLTVDAPFQAVPGSIRFGRVATSDLASASTDVVSLNERGERLTGTFRAPPNVEATLELVAIGTTEGWKVKARLLPPIPLGAFELQLSLDTTGPGGEGSGRPFTIPLIGVGLPDVVASPDRFIFTSNAAGSRAEIEVQVNLRERPLIVQSVSLEGLAAEALKSGFEPIAPGPDGRSRAWKVWLAAESALPEALEARARIRLDDPAFPELIVPLHLQRRVASR